MIMSNPELTKILYETGISRTLQKMYDVYVTHNIPKKHILEFNMFLEELYDTINDQSPEYIESIGIKLIDHLSGAAEQTQSQIQQVIIFAKMAIIQSLIAYVIDSHKTTPKFSVISGNKNESNNDSNEKKKRNHLTLIK